MRPIGLRLNTPPPERVWKSGEADRPCGTSRKESFSEIPDIRGNLFFDAHTAILMRKHGIRTIYTRDTDFNRFPFVEVVDPLQQFPKPTGLG